MSMAQLKIYEDDVEKCLEVIAKKQNTNAQNKAKRELLEQEQVVALKQLEQLGFKTKEELIKSVNEDNNKLIEELLKLKEELGLL